MMNCLECPHLVNQQWCDLADDEVLYIENVEDGCPYWCPLKEDILDGNVSNVSFDDEE